MRKLFSALLGISFMALIGAAGTSDFESQHTPKETVIMSLYSVDRDESVFEDRDGNLWTVEDCLFQYATGSEFLVTMDRKGTVDYRDDEVVEYKHIN